MTSSINSYFNRGSSAVPYVRPQSNCQNCNRVFSYSPSKGSPRFCTYTCCADFRRRTGETARPKDRALITCETCKESKEVVSSRANGKRGQGRFCSQACMIVWRSSRVASVRYRADHRITCICEFCRKPFEKMKCQVKQGRGKFCSRACLGSATVRKQGRVSKQEYRFGAALLAAGLAPTEQARFGKWLVDFYFPSFGLAVEFDGTYWHGTDAGTARDARKDKELKRRGIRILRVPEKLWNEDPDAAVALVTERIHEIKESMQ